MSSVKVIDLQNEAVEEEAPAPEPIEEAKEETPEPVAQRASAGAQSVPPVVDTANEIIEETNEPPTEEAKEEKPKRQTQKDRINCPKCFKDMSVKSFKYSHEQKCQGKLSDKPVKPHSKPKAKPKPKPIPQPVYEDEYEDEYEEDKENITPKLSAPVRNQILKPQTINPFMNIQQHYQLLQNEYIKQKQEKYNNLCQNMFSNKTKKR